MFYRILWGKEYGGKRWFGSSGKWHKGNKFSWKWFSSALIRLHGVLPQWQRRFPGGQILITVLVGEEHFQATKQPPKYLLVKGSNLHNITFKQVIGFPFCRKKKALNCLVALWWVEHLALVLNKFIRDHLFPQANWLKFQKMSDCTHDCEMIGVAESYIYIRIYRWIFTKSWTINVYKNHYRQASIFWGEKKEEGRKRHKPKPISLGFLFFFFLSVQVHLGLNSEMLPRPFSEVSLQITCYGCQTRSVPVVCPGQGWESALTSRNKNSRGRENFAGLSKESRKKEGDPEKLLSSVLQRRISKNLGKS